MPDFSDSGQPTAGNDPVFDLFEVNESKDAGISLFEEKMYQAEQALEIMYVGKPEGNWSHAEAILEELSELWDFDGDTATVSGRVYVIEDEAIDNTPEEWGEPQHEEGVEEPFYYVEDAQLVSRGLDTVVTWNYDDGVVKSFKLGYLFSLPDDPNEQGNLVMFPDLATISYDNPSLMEVRRRLEHRWPEQLKFLKQMIKPDLQTSLPRRLLAVENRLQADLKGSQELQELVSPYMTVELNLDEVAPYLAKLKGMFQYFEGANPHDETAPGEWKDVELSEDMTMFAFDPCVHVITDSEGNARIRVWAKAYSMESDDPEYISLNPNNITDFRSTRAIRSMGTRATLLSSDDSSDQMTSDLTHTVDSLNDVGHIKLVGPEVKKTNTPEEIQAMELLEKAFQEVARVIKSEQATLYGSAEQAKEASERLLRTFIADKLLVAGIDEKFELLLSGRTPQVPRERTDLFDAGRPSPDFAVAIDAANPLQSIPENEATYGVFYSLRPFVSEIKTEKQGIVGYRVNPTMVVTTSHESHSALTWETVDLYNVTIDKKALVPLDGSAEVKIRELEEHRKKRMVLGRLNIDYRKSALKDNIHQLEAALHAEQRSKYKDLAQVGRLRELDAQIKQLIQAGEDPETALDAIKSVFVNRVVQVKGETLVKLDETLLLDVDSESLIDGHTGGIILDVRNDLVGDDVMFVINLGVGENKYIPIKTIEALRF